MEARTVTEQRFSLSGRKMLPFRLEKRLPVAQALDGLAYTEKQVGIATARALDFAACI